jgi:signal peptide peptidase SppA
MSLINALTTRLWAIKPENLQLLANIALRKNFDPQMINPVPGMPMKGARTAIVRGNVAIIPVTGPLFPKASMMDTMCGAVSMEVIAQDISAAMENPNVDGIMLDIDSPGGVAFGPAETADIIAKYAQTKPIIAYVAGMACSAAYWIASAATEIVAHKSAILGSIGVVCAYGVQQGLDQDGYKHFEIVSSNAKNKRPDPTTDAGKAEIMRELNDIERVFIGDVAKNRGVTEETVKTQFGEGGVLIAEDAIRVGMADRLGSFEDALSGFQTSLHLKRKGGQMANNKPADPAATQPGAPQTVDVDAIKAAAREEGAKAERERILALDEVAVDGAEAMLKEAKADGKTTAEQLALKILKQHKQLGADYIKNTTASVEQTPKIEPSANNNQPASPPNPDKVDESLPLEEQAKKAYEKDKALQAEFKTVEVYTAFVKSQADGRGRIVKPQKG